MATSVSLGYCGWLAGATWSDTVGRNLNAGLTAMGASRAGVLPNVANALQVLSGSGMNAAANPGSAVIPAATVAAGPYLPVNNVVQTLTHNASDPTNPRIDIWVIQVVDNGNSTSFGQIQIVAGTPAASPVAPSAPATSLVLAQVRINAGVSTFNQSSITDMRVFSACAGGIMLCPNMASLPAGWPGLIGYDLTNSRLFALTATGAQPIHVLSAPPALAIATANFTVTALSVGTEQTVLSVNFTADGVSDYEYIAKFTGASSSAGSFRIIAHLYADSTLVQENWITSSSVSGNNLCSGNNVIHTTSSLKGTTPAAGAHTVTFKAYNDFLSSGQNSVIRASSTFPIELSVRQVSL